MLNLEKKPIRLGQEVYIRILICQKMPNETTKVKGQPIPHMDMHGCGYGMSDIYRCAPIHSGRHQGTNTIRKCHPSPSKHAVHSQI